MATSATSETSVPPSSATSSQVSQKAPQDDTISIIITMEPISEAMQRCCDAVLPVLMDSNKIIKQLDKNTGLFLFKQFISKFQAIFDRSCARAVECSATLHRIGSYMAGAQLTKQDIEVFTGLLKAVNDDVALQSARFQELHQELLEMFSSSALFLPPEGPVPTANENEDHYLHIVACVRSHVTYKRGQTGLKEFSDVEETLRKAELFIMDCHELRQWWEAGSNQCIVLLRKMHSPDDFMRDPVKFSKQIWSLYNHIKPWASKTNSLIEYGPTDRMWPATGELLTEVKRINALPSAEQNTILPPKRWKHRQLVKTNYSLIAKQLDLPMRKEANRNVQVNASVTKCQHFPLDGTYGLRVKIQHREPPGLQNRRRLVRCGMMTVTLSISSQDPTCKKQTAIISMAPERSSHSKSEAKYSVKATAKAAPSAAGIKVGEVGVEVGREVTRSDSAMMQGLLTRGGDAAWSLVENKSSKSGVADCEIGIVFTPPSKHVIVKLDIEATYVVDIHFKMFPWTVTRTENIPGSLAIDLAEATQQIPTLNTTQQGFLEPCSPLVAKLVS